MLVYYFVEMSSLCFSVFVVFFFLFFLFFYLYFFFFFFQAEDGIRDTSVTGVQTCALPISKRWSRSITAGRAAFGLPACLPIGSRRSSNSVRSCRWQPPYRQPPQRQTRPLNRLPKRPRSLSWISCDVSPFSPSARLFSWSPHAARSAGHRPTPSRSHTRPAR